MYAPTTRTIDFLYYLCYNSDMAAEILWLVIPRGYTMASATKMRGEQYTALLQLTQEELKTRGFFCDPRPSPFGICFAEHEDLSKPVVTFVCGYTKGFVMTNDAVKFQMNQLAVIVETLETLSEEFPQWSRDRLAEVKTHLTT